LILEQLERAGVDVFPGSIAWLRELRWSGLKTAVVSSSRNATAVPAHAGITSLFDAQVDGDTAFERHLSGKPAPDTFLEGARRLGVSPGRAVVVGDAVAGVAAGRVGKFGLVIGVDRDGHAADLADHGAKLVVADLSELLAPPADPVHRAGPREHRLLAAAKRILAATDDYAPDPWRLIEHRYNPGYIEQTETLFAVSNGFLGIRGSFEEGEPLYRPETLPQRFPRDLADRLPRERARVRHHWSDDRAGPGRDHHPLVRRRRSDHLPDGGGPGVRARPGHAQRCPGPVSRVPVGGRTAVPGRHPEVRVARPTALGLHPLRGNGS
jgi:HAD superfamily hydrolase (TIGR01509 family)